MDQNKIYLLLFFTLVSNVYSLQVEPGDDSVGLTHVAAGYRLEMDENNHEINHNRTLFKINGASNPKLSNDPGFSYVLVQNGEESWSFLSTYSFDYETQPWLYNIIVVDGSEDITLSLHIINIDDEQPTFSCPKYMQMIQNHMYDEHNSSCSCTLTDPDGWLNQTTFKIVSNMEDKQNEFFDFKFSIPVEDDTVHEAIIKVVTKKCIDLADTGIYSFDLRVKDGAGHTTTPDELVPIYIQIWDVPLPPCAANQ